MILTTIVFHTELNYGNQKLNKESLNVSVAVGLKRVHARTENNPAKFTVNEGKSERKWKSESDTGEMKRLRQPTVAGDDVSRFSQVRETGKENQEPCLNPLKIYTVSQDGHQLHNNQ